MIHFTYRISCVISVPKQELLAHAFHYAIDEASINETYNSPGNSLRLIPQTIHEIFQPMIEEYATQYGLVLSDIVINNYLVASGNSSITVSFMKNGIEKKFETTDDSMTAVAYYHENANLGYGLELYDYLSTLPNNTYTMRVGKEVPEGDVNLSFVHTPALNANENISFIDSSFTDDNMIPADQLEAIVIPDSTGVLCYADVLSDTEPMVKRAPYNRIPSKEINLTRRFKSNQLNLDSALFYKFDLTYHYDSEVGVPGQVKLYQGSQIQITDENGNLLDPSQYKYMIYARSMEKNPKIYWVKIYLQVNTDETTTFKVRYNHVDAVLPDDQLRSSQKVIELYANDGNLNYIEGGKLRIINGRGAYESASLATVKSSKDVEEYYFIEDQPDRDGYRITVPQKSKADPRLKTSFNYKLSATFTDDAGQEHTLTFGYISDWVINPEALLDHERYDYTQNQKSLGLKIGTSFFNARNLMKMMMPLDMPDLPDDTVFKIEDANGQLTYLVQSASNNTLVNTTVDTAGQNVPQATAVTQSPVWAASTASNVKVVNNPIPHLVTIFPEQQKNEFDFSWEASGSGLVHTKLQYHNQYKVAQDIYVLKENNRKIYDVYSDWGFIGAQGEGNWHYYPSDDTLLNNQDYDTFTGFYDTQSTGKTDYRFSAIINVNNDNDDDVIALMFRVRNTKEFYAFMWQRQAPIKSSNSGHALFSRRGEDFVVYPVAAAGSTDHTLATDDWNAYLNWPDSFQQKNAKIYKAEPSSMPAFDGNLIPNCRYKRDVNGIAYTDITADTNYNPTGWLPHQKYKVTVVCVGFHYQVYISNDLSDEALGALVCEAFNDSYLSGSVGVGVKSQSGVEWTKIQTTDVIRENISTDWMNLTLLSHEEVKVSDISAAEMVKDLATTFVLNKYGANFPFIRNSPYPIPKTSDLNIRVRADGFIWAQTDTYSAGGIQTTVWETNTTGNNIKGTGHAWIRGDGTFGYDIHPPVLTKDHIPGNVESFQWTQIWPTGGDEVYLSIGTDDSVVAKPGLPPIKSIGKPYTIPIDHIYKQDGLKSLGDLFGDNGLIQKMNIPSAVPLEQLMFRIERGDKNGNNMEYRVNYRWHLTLGTIERFEVDQLYKGINRLRVSNLLKPDMKNLLDGIQVELVAWTNYEELESVPVLALKIDDNRKIHLEKPKVESRSMEIDNWYIRVKNGHIRKRLRLPYFEEGEKIPQLYVMYPELISYVPNTPGDLNEVILDYTVPEYTNQDFYDRPYVLVEREYPTILNETMIQTRYAPIVLSSDKGISYLEVQAIRRNSARKLRIADVDAKKGIIYLHDKIKDQDDVIVQYAYDEEWYTYRGYHKEKYTVTPVISNANLNLSFDVTLKASITYDPSELTINSINTVEPWSPVDKIISTGSKILFLYRNQSPSGTWNNHDTFIQLLTNNGAIVEQKEIENTVADDLAAYSFIIITNLQYTVSAAKVQMIQDYFQNGGSGMIVSEHLQLSSWIQSFDQIMAPFSIKTVPSEMVFTTGYFDKNNPFTADISNLHFSVDYASSLSNTNPDFQPIAYAPDGKVMGVIKEVNKQKMIVLSDSNFIATKFTSDQLNDPTNGNGMFCKKLANETTVTHHEDLKAQISSTHPVTEVRVFINKPFQADGTGAYNEAISYPSGDQTIVLTSYIKNANDSSMTGDLIPAQMNNVIIEFLNSKAALDQKTISFTYDY